MAARRRFVNHFSRLSCIVCTHEPAKKNNQPARIPRGIVDSSGQSQDGGALVEPG